MSKEKIIFWDFDGVILNSNKVRDSGFERVLKEYPKTQVDLLLKYHRKNGGLSRYVKFRYFFEVIREEKVSMEKISVCAQLFSDIMLEELKNEDLLIMDTIEFIKANRNKYVMHIVSGSDGDELNILCEYLGIVDLFKTISGSPTAKYDLVKNIMEDFKYIPELCILIGDSVNDYEAAIKNNISFLGYNCHIDGMVNEIKSFRQCDLDVYFNSTSVFPPKKSY